MPIANKLYELDNFHSEVIRECFTPQLPLDMAMVLFGVLHCCVLKLRYPATGGQALNIAPLTSRSCAEALAAVWQNFPESIFTEEYLYNYWWGEWGGSARLELVSKSDASLAVEVKRMLESHEAIAQVISEYEELNPFVPTI